MRCSAASTVPSVVGRRQRLVGPPGRPKVAGQSDHLGTDRGVVAIGRLEDVFGGQRRIGEGMTELLGEQVGPEESIAGRVGDDVVSQVGLQASDCSLGGFRCGAEAGQDGTDSDVSGGGGLGLAEGVVCQLGDAGQLLERRLGVEARDRSIGRPDERLDGAIDDVRQALEPLADRSEARCERREVPSDEREQAVAEQVRPRDRVPGILAKAGLGESMSVELEQEEVSIEALVAREVGVRHRPELAGPAVVERDPPLPTGLGHIRPAAVELVRPGVRRPDRVEREVLVEEGGRPVGEGAGHRAGV